MTEIVSSAEVAHKRHVQDKGVSSLIHWFRAELALQDESTRQRLEQHSDEYLTQHQNEVEYLALAWRKKRLAPVLVAAA